MEINWNIVKSNGRSRRSNKKSDASIHYGKTKNGNAMNAIAFYKNGFEKLGIEKGSKLSFGFYGNRAFVSNLPSQEMFEINTANYIYDIDLVEQILLRLTHKVPSQKSGFRMFINFVELNDHPGVFEIKPYKEVDDFSKMFGNGVYEAH
jgi:hypothetical protein